MTRDEALAQLTAKGRLRDHKRPCERATITIFQDSAFDPRRLIQATASDLPFTVYQEERETFASIYAKSAALAHALKHECKVAKGDRVAIAMRNYPDWVVAYMAITSMGAVAVALNALWQTDELAYGISHVDARWLIADDERISRIGEIESPGCQLISVRSGPLPGVAFQIESLIESNLGQPMPEADIDPDDAATIFFTSGSTGFPKGACRAIEILSAPFFPGNLISQHGRWKRASPSSERYQPATLLAVPLFHTTGANAVMLQSFRAQRKMVSMYRWDPAIAATLIEQEHITSFIAPAAMTGDLVQHAQAASVDLSALLSVGGGGAPRAPAQVRSIMTPSHQRSQAPDGE